MPHGSLVVCGNSDEVAAKVADLFIDTARTAIAERDAFRVALSGGNTPRNAYALLARAPRLDAVAWPKVFIYFGDERCVPPNDPESNYRMAEESFLRAVPIPSGNVHRIRCEADPGHAANEYSSLVRHDLGDPPHFDLVLLGMGPDGHTASLFPGQDPTIDSSDLVRAIYAESQRMWRVTITPKVINAARVVAFAVEGTTKADALAAVYQGPTDCIRYPAQIVDPKDGKLVWIVDRLAAAELTPA